MCKRTVLTRSCKSPFWRALALASAIAFALALVPMRSFAAPLQNLADVAVNGETIAEAASGAAARDDIGEAAIVGLRPAYEFRGKPVKPKVQVMVDRISERDNGDGTATVTQVLCLLEEGRDYTVSYRHAAGIGTARVVVRGRGAFRGTLAETYDIMPARTRLAAINPGRGKLDVRCSKVKGGCSYQFAYKGKDGAWQRVSGRKAARTLSGLKRGETYTAKARAYKTVGGTRRYGKWSKPKAMAVKPWKTCALPGIDSPRGKR